MSNKKVTLKVNDGSSMQCYISMPEGKGPFPAIMVIQEAFGVNSHIRNVSDRITNEGYVVISPELFHRTAPIGFEGSYTDFAALQPHFQGITVEGLSADVKACYEWLQNEPSVIKSKIGCIGYC